MALNLIKVVSRCALAMGVAAALVTSVAAQGTLRSVTFYNVKPDRVGDFQAEIKQYNAVLAKGGSTRYNSVFLSLTGPRTYVLARTYQTWAELDAGADPKMKDQVAELAQINMRIVNCTDSSRRIIEEVNPDLSLPDTGAIPTMIRVIVSQVRPDKVSDYLAMVKADVLPAIKKSGQNFFSISQGRYGEPNSVVTSVLGINNWGDLDGGVGAQKGMSKAEFSALTMKVGSLVVSSQYDILRFQPDLSYLPGPPAK